MNFIIHSRELLERALKLEEAIGKKCYVPGRDTPQTTGEEILPINAKAMKESEEDVYVLWNGESQGTIFDMGMAYITNRKLHFIELVTPRTWTWFFKRMEGKIFQLKE